MKWACCAAQEEKPSRLYVPMALFVTVAAFRQDF